MSAQTRQKELGDFLRTRRENIHPSQIGIPDNMRRRTPGLRREEVAYLAGIGLTWYTRLEQGKEIQVSKDVIESLARVFMLTSEERFHLYQLANLPTPTESINQSFSLSPTVQIVLDELIACPSIVVNAYQTVVGWNRAACILFGDFPNMPLKERNILWSMFMLPHYQNYLVNWASHAQNLVAKFRSTYDTYINDTQMRNLIDELLEKSEAFSNYWKLHEIHYDNEVDKKFQHPTLGTLSFTVSNFFPATFPAGKMIVHTPMEGTGTRKKIEDYLRNIP